MTTAERLDSGVRAYHGDNPIPFSEYHRRNLPRDFYKMDLDFMVSSAGGMDTECRHFHGYVIRNHSIGTVAVFDLKETVDAIYAKHNRVRHMYQTHLCRMLGSVQPVAPVFVYIVGDGPFEAYAVDLDSCDVSVTSVTLPLQESWLTAWDALGITAAKSTIEAWLAS